MARPKMVLEMRPPVMAMATGLSISFPDSPWARTSGMRARPAEKAVIRTGRRRSWVPRMIRSLPNGMASSFMRLM